MADEISDLMSKNRDKVISLRLRDDKTLEGRLRDFDVHMNLTLDDARDVSGPDPVDLGNILLRGVNIISISLPEETGE